MSVRENYVARFGETEAAALEQAAEFHVNEFNGERGSDPFKWACLIAIGYECAEVERYRVYHKIAAPWADIKEWMKTEADLGTHNGGFDALSLFAGTYTEYLGTGALPEEATA